MFVVLNEFRNHFLAGAYDDIVGNLVDGCIGVVVDRDDDARILHTGDVLDLSADTAGNVYLGMYGHTRLADLAVMVYPTGIDSRTASAYLAMKLLGKLEQQVKTFLAAHAIATSHNNRRALEVVLGCLYMTVKNFHDISRLRHIVIHIGIYDLASG